MKYVINWVFGGLAAVYPIWQARKLSNLERVTEPESYIGKGPTHIALPIALLLTVIATFVFILTPDVLDVVFYWLIGASAIVAIISVIAMIQLLKDLKADEQNGGE